MTDGFSAPNPTGAPDNSAPSNPTPFHGSGSSWKRNLLIAAVVVVIGGGAASYYLNQDSSEEYYSSATVTTTEDTYEDDYYDDFYEDDYYDDFYEDDYYDDFWTYSEEEYDVLVSETEGFYTFVDYNYGFEIDYPADWYLEPAWDLTFFTSDYEDSYDYLFENVSITTEDVAWYGPLTDQEYADASLGYLLEDPYYTYVNQGTQNFGSYEGMYMLGTYDIGGGDVVGVWDVFTIQDGMVYFFTYIYELPEKDMYVDLIDHMVESFKLTFVSEASVDDADFAEIPEEDFGFASLLHLRD